MAYDDSHPARVVNIPSFARPRHIPDVPQDVDFLLDHLNDPNYDMTKVPLTASTETFNYDDHKRMADGLSRTYSTKGSDFDTDSAIESTRYSAPSRMSDFTDFDEYVVYFVSCITRLMIHQRITVSGSPLFSI